MPLPEATRRDASERIDSGRHPLRETVFEFIRLRGDRGATDHEIAGELMMLMDTARARRCELRDAGRIVDSGEARSTPSGRRAIVWVAVEDRLAAGLRPALRPEAGDDHAVQGPTPEPAMPADSDGKSEGARADTAAEPWAVPPRQQSRLF